MRTAAGILAIAGGLLVVVACALPYVKFTVGNTTQTQSLFDFGAGAAKSEYWFTVEPVSAILLGLIGGALLLMPSRRRLTVVAAGGLIVLGIQSTFLFAGYALGTGGGGSHAGPGGWIGVLAGVLLVVCGIIGAAGLAREDQVQAAGTGGSGTAAAAPAYPPPYPAP
jgi:hypothetical protein